MVKGHDSDIADLLRGDDALLDASKKGDLDRVKKLVTPENINCRDEQGRNSTPLHLAGMVVNCSTLLGLLGRREGVGNLRQLDVVTYTKKLPIH